jgi:hypothetical protein
MAINLPYINNRAYSPVKFICFYLFIFLSFNIQAASGPSVKQLSDTLNTTWQTLMLKTSCNRPSPQDSQCIQAYHGKSISVKLFGRQLNALIIFETRSTADVTGPVITQQSGFLIGPLNGYGYKIVQEQMTHGLIQKRRTTYNGIKVYAHKVNGNGVEATGIELNKGTNWLDGKHGPWIYHWSSLAEASEVLKQIDIYLNNTYSN